MCQPAMLRRGDVTALTCGIERTIRIVEQPQGFFDAQYAAHRCIERCCRHSTLIDQFGQMRRVQAALHTHVDACQYCEPSGILIILRIAVQDQFLVGRVVGNDEALEVPLATQHLRHQVRTRGCRHAVDVVESAHGRQGASLECRLKRREMNFAQRLLGNIDRVVIKTGSHGAVRREMFRRGEQRIFRGEAGSLETAHAGGREQLAEIHIFTRAFAHAAPTLIARHIDHGRKGPVHTDGSGFHGSGPGGFFSKLRLEARRLGQRDREHRAQPVNHVRAEQQRNLQTRLFDSRPLRAQAACHTNAVEQSAHPTGTDFLEQFLGLPPIRLRIDTGFCGTQLIVQQVELPDLFLDGHARHQRLDLRVWISAVHDAAPA